MNTPVQACPLAAVERRLSDAAGLWRKASEAYFDPDEFRVHLHSCIQTFRTVTWILQNQKTAFVDFEGWYSGWQKTMREDPVLRWLVEARNKIEKQGDLEAKSILRVTASGSWFDGPSLDKEFPPMTRPENIQVLMKPLLRRKDVTEEALLKIERRWIDTNLPESEVLEALCHSYLVLRKIVLEAHGRLKNPVECQFHMRATRSNEELPQFMLISAASRVTWTCLKDETSLSIQHIGQTFYIDDPKNEEAVTRYGLDKEKTKERFVRAKSFKDQCEIWFQNSKRMLQVDGYLIPSALLKTDQNTHLFQLRMEDRAQKHAVIRSLAEKCRQLDAKSVILISEAWVAPGEFAKTGKHANDCPERAEAIVLHGLTHKGNTIFCSNVFTRAEGRIHFSTDKISETGGIAVNILAPFMKVWGIKPSNP